MTRWMTLSVAALFMAAVSIQAQDAAPVAPPAAAPAGKQVKHEKKGDRHADVAAVAVSISGKLSKEQKKGKDGVEKTVYIVTSADGKAVLTPDATVTAAVLDAMVDKDVTATGTGGTMEHGGKKMTHFKTLTSVVLK